MRLGISFERDFAPGCTVGYHAANLSVMQVVRSVPDIMVSRSDFTDAHYVLHAI